MANFVRKLAASAFRSADAATRDENLRRSQKPRLHSDFARFDDLSGRLFQVVFISKTVGGTRRRPPRFVGQRELRGTRRTYPAAKLCGRFLKFATQFFLTLRRHAA